MLQCEVLFGEARAVEIQELVEGATGRPCPCKVDERCVLTAAPALELVPTVA